MNENGAKMVVIDISDHQEIVEELRQRSDKVIETQRQEIDRLKARLDDGCVEAMRLRAEVERLRGLCMEAAGSRGLFVLSKRQCDRLEAAGRGEGDNGK